MSDDIPVSELKPGRYWVRGLGRRLWYSAVVYREVSGELRYFRSPWDTENLPVKGDTGTWRKSIDGILPSQDGPTPRGSVDGLLEKIPEPSVHAQVWIPLVAFVAGALIGRYLL